MTRITAKFPAALFFAVVFAGSLSANGLDPADPDVDDPGSDPPEPPKLCHPAFVYDKGRRKILGEGCDCTGAFTKSCTDRQGCTGAADQAIAETKCGPETTFAPKGCYPIKQMFTLRDRTRECNSKKSVGCQLVSDCECTLVDVPGSSTTKHVEPSCSSVEAHENERPI